MLWSKAEDLSWAKAVRFVMYINTGAESHGCLSWRDEYKLGSAESVSVARLGGPRKAKTDFMGSRGRISFPSSSA